MCGISGVVNFDRAQPVDPGLIRSMSDIMAHRGPDGHGEYVAGPVALGHRRLSIVDLGGGAQPMCNEDSTVWVVFNGEIYNFVELRSELQALGHVFKSSSDTEVIVHAYEEWGTTSVQRLSGMFAFAIWDARKQQLLLARDRVGIKPLYYSVTDRSILFASELKALLVSPAVSRGLRAAALDRFLTYYYLPGRDTLLEGIQKLEPGHLMVVRDGAARDEQYWDLKFTEAGEWPTLSDAADALRTLLRSTVRSHLVSDVPVGVLLSGGVDSTGILRYASEESTEALHSFTIGFGGEGFADERPYARIAAEQYGTGHQDITFTSTDFLDFLPRYVWHMEEPVCEPPAVALYYVSRLARQSGVKVLLSGEGGDEAFGGYQTYRNLLFLERLKSASPRSLLRSSLRAAGVWWGRLAPYAPLVDQNLSDYYLSRTATPQTMFNRSKGALYRPEFVEAIGDSSAYASTQYLFDRVDGRPLLDQMLYVDTKTWLPDDLLVKADKMTMAASVELRVPLLDYRVLEFAASLPRKFKVQGWSGKRVLKTALQDSVPSPILRRKKTGFPVPYDRWFRSELAPFVRETILAANAALTEYFQSGVLRRMVDGFFDNGTGSKEVFCLVVLELWLQRFATGNVQQQGALALSPVGV